MEICSEDFMIKWFWFCCCFGSFEMGAYSVTLPSIKLAMTQ